MLGSKINNLVSAAIDISDGFLGDLNKLLNYNLGASLSILDMPFSNYSKELIADNLITPIKLLSGGDDYELIFTSNSKNENKINKIANLNKIKVSKVGRIISKKGIFIDGKNIKNSYDSYEYFF